MLTLGYPLGMDSLKLTVGIVRYFVSSVQLPVTEDAIIWLIILYPIGPVPSGVYQFLLLSNYRLISLRPFSRFLPACTLRFSILPFSFFQWPSRGPLPNRRSA